MTLQPVTDDTFRELVLERPGASVVLFTKPGCRSCTPVLDEIEDLSEQRPDVGFFSVDVAANRALCTMFCELGVPLVSVIHDGMETWHRRGASTRAAQISEHLDAGTE